MKRKTLFIPAILLICAGYLFASDPPQTRPMTRYEKAIANITDLNELKNAYDTLKTDYDRRYFLNALPGYFADHQITAVPAWVEKAVLVGIKSNDPLYVFEAVRAAGALKINHSDELMNLYPAVGKTFGCHEDMIKSSILNSLSQLDNTNKQQFYYKILTMDTIPVLSTTFGALLIALSDEPSQIYNQKLAEYSTVIGAKITEMEAQSDDEKKIHLQEYKELKERIDGVLGKVATGGGK